MVNSASSRLQFEPKHALYMHRFWPTKNASEIASRSKRRVRGQKFNVGAVVIPSRFTEDVRADFRAQNRLDFRRIVRIGVVMGWPSQSRPLKGLASRFAGLWVVRASSPAPRTNGA